MKKDYLISVVIPIYNVKAYLEETINSIIKQTIGFENIQLILVNDGSPYGEDEICKKYDELYDNVVYINQENSGVSKARNNGMAKATGKYINFIDSDDKLEHDAFEKAIKMLDENPDINVVGLRLKFFEATKGYHITDYRFDKGDRVVDLNEDYSALQLSAASSVMRRSALKGIEFDSTIKYSEDAKFVTEVLFKNKTLKYGLIRSSNYLYRRRRDRNSSIQNQTFNQKWYSYTCRKVYEYVMDLSQEIFGTIIPYAQYFAMYHLQYRVDKAVDIGLPKEEKLEYKKCIKEMVDKIDDYIILDQRGITLDQKIQILNLKYDKDVSKDFSIKDGKIYYKNIYVQDLDNYKFSLIKVEENTNNVILKLLINTFINEKEIAFTAKNGIQDIKYTKTDVKMCEYYEEYYPSKKIVELIIPKKNNRIKVKYQNTKLSFNGIGLFAILFSPNYYYKFNNMLINIGPHSLVISKGILRKVYRRLVNFFSMLGKYNRQLIVLMLSGLLKKKYGGYNIAFIYDEDTLAYIKENYPKKTFYVSTEKQYSTISNKSFKYKLYYLNAKNIYLNYKDVNKIIVKKPFGKATKLYVNKMNACYNIITNKKIPKKDLETLNTVYKKINIIELNK